MNSPQYKSPFFLLRTPLLPYSELHKIFRITNEDELKKLLNNPLVSEALHLGSQDLAGEISRWLSGGEIEQSKKKRLIRALLSYYIRMSTRCIPFGLFAGITPGKWSDHNRLALKDSCDIIRRLRPDMEFLADWAHKVSQEPRIAEKLIYYTNNSIYQKANVLGYIETKLATNQTKYSLKERMFSLSSFDINPVNKLIIRKARKGLLFEQLVAILTELSVPADTAQAYIQELIRENILVNELEPHLCGKAYLSVLIEKFSRIDAGYHTQLKAIEDQLQKINNPGDTNQLPVLYEQLRDCLKVLNPGSEGNRNILQMDTIRPCIQATLDKRIVHDIVKGVKLLHSLDNTDYHQSYFNRFKRAFEERYEHEVVPLMEVFDNEVGIGYNIVVSDKDSYPPAVGIRFNEVAKFKFGLYRTALQTGVTAIDISDYTPKGRETSRKMPNVMSALISLYHREGETPAIHLKYAVNSSSKLFGRFSYDPDISEGIRVLHQMEEQLEPEKIFAEIVHLPKDRVGNIAFRSHVRDYEIPILTRSHLDDKNILPLSDLFLFIREGRLVLWSKSRKKEVMPRMSIAHNYYGYTAKHKNLPVYQFLCDYQHQDDELHASWNWEFLINEPFLPRITYKNLILSPMRWNIDVSKYSVLTSGTKDQQMAAVDEIIRDYKLPSDLVVNSFDNDLLLDLTNDYCRMIFLQKLKKSAYVKLYENLWDDTYLVAKSGDRGYTNEVIVPIINYETNNGRNQAPETLSVSTQKIKIKRSFPPGSQWYYLKIYVSRPHAEKLLAELYTSVITPLLKQKTISKWFFLRYNDPKFHLRIRVWVDDIKNLPEVIQRLNVLLEKKLSQKRINKASNDTYIREIERFGAANIEDSEDYFFRNSELCIELLQKMKGIDDAKNRFLTALFGVDFIFKGFNFSVERRAQIYKKLSGNFLKNTRPTYRSNLRNFTKINYTQDAVFLATIVDDRDANEGIGTEIKTVLKKHESAFKTLCSQIIANLKNDYDQVEKVATIYSHLFMNRFINAGTFFWEPAAYVYLSKLLESYVMKNRTYEAVNTENNKDTVTAIESRNRAIPSRKMIIDTSLDV